MASQTQPSEKNRRRRQPRNKATTDSAPDEPTLSDDIIGQTQAKKGQKKKPAQRNRAESALSQQIEQVGATTPPRQNGGRNVNDVILQNGQKNNRKKNGSHNEGVAGTPASKNPRGHNGNATTPNKPAIEAYAGPTFHASPAPSALPVPKFFSKSAPSADQNVGIAARLQEDGTGSSESEQCPESPSLRSATKASTTGTVANPPTLFDMLINADRQEKERQRAGHDGSPYRGTGISENTKASQNNERLRHNRTLTAGSIFPMDMDASSGRSTPASIHLQPVQQSRQGSPGHPNQSRPFSSNDEANLKRMLFSPPNLNQSNAHPHGVAVQSSPGWASSPASRPDTSPYGTPSPASSYNGLASSSRPAPVSPYTQSSPSPTARRSQYPPQNISGLRREVSPNQLDRHNGTSHLVAQDYAANFYNGNGNNQNSSPVGSPVAQRFPSVNGYNGNYSPYGSHGHNSPARNHSPSAYQNTPPTKRFSAQDALQASFGKNGSSGNLNVTGMENELRKILRLDDLRTTSATAPQT